MDAVEGALAEFERIMKRPGLFWDPRHWAITKAEFKARITAAMRGKLRPVTQVKEIDRGANEFVFEIIYDFPVIQIDSSGKRTSVKARVRLYISEPPLHPNHFVGLHIHEKVIIAGNNKQTNSLQNIEIDAAVSVYQNGRATNWGI